MCGWNGSGQLGIGHFTNINVPVPVSGLQQQIIKVACGWNHTMSLTSMSSAVILYVKARVHFGLLVKVMYLYAYFVSAVCTCSVFIDLGELYTWGSNSFGQLGLPQVHRHTSTPERLSQEVNMSACVASLHNCVLTYIYTC